MGGRLLESDGSPAFLVADYTTGAHRATVFAAGELSLPDIEDTHYTWAEAEDAGFGNGVSFIEDPGGDGVPEVVVGAPGDKYHDGRAYVFDGSLTGVVSSADADAVLQGGNQGFFWMEDAGDLNQDGHGDLLYTFARSEFQVAFGPFEGARTLEATLPGVVALGPSDVDGDGALDVVAMNPWEGEIYLFPGPVSSGTLEASDAAASLPYPLEAVTCGALADPDADGVIDLVFGDQGHDNEPGEAQGLLLVMPLVFP